MRDRIIDCIYDGVDPTDGDLDCNALRKYWRDADFEDDKIEEIVILEPGAECTDKYTIAAVDAESEIDGRKISISGEVYSMTNSTVVFESKAHKDDDDKIDGFKECGSGFMHTFRGGKKMVRIDYIFHDKALEGVSFYKKDLSYSDHYPVFLRITTK